MTTYYYALTDNDQGNTLNAFSMMVPNPFDIGIFDTWYYNPVYGKGGDDTIGTQLGSMSVSLYGGDGNDTITGGDGTDTLYGDDWDGTVASGNGDDVIHGGASADQIFGGSGHDKVYGDAGDDTIYAGPGKDRLEGGDGLDMLYARGGNDVMLGGADADTFVIMKADGRDVIKDFAAKGIGHDFIDLSDMSAVDSFKDLIKNHAEDDHGDVILSLGNNSVLVIEDVKIKQLIHGDFIF